MSSNPIPWRILVLLLESFSLYPEEYLSLAWRVSVLIFEGHWSPPCRVCPHLWWVSVSILWKYLYSSGKRLFPEEYQSLPWKVSVTILERHRYPLWIVSVLTSDKSPSLENMIPIHVQYQFLPWISVPTVTSIHTQPWEYQSLTWRVSVSTKERIRTHPLEYQSLT